MFCYANEVFVLLCPFNKMVIECTVLFQSSLSHSGKWSNLKRGHENSQVRSQASPSEEQIVPRSIWSGGNPRVVGVEGPRQLSGWRFVPEKTTAYIISGVKHFSLRSPLPPHLLIVREKIGVRDWVQSYGQRFNQSCLCKATSTETLNNKILRAS